MTADEQDPLHPHDRSAEGPYRRLKRLTIDDLFGPSTPQIDILLRLDQRVTVLHGRNGSGKTITLNLLAALCRGHFEQLDRYPFSRLELETTDGATLTISKALGLIRRRAGVGEESIATTHRYKLSLPGRPPEEGEIPRVPPEDLANIAKKRGFQRNHRHQWDHLTGDRERDDVDLIQEIREIYGEEALPSLIPEDSQLASFLRTLAPIKFIRADRLYERNRLGDPELTIERLGRGLRRVIVAADRQYRAISSQLDSSLAKRLFAAHKDLPTLDQLRKRSRHLHERTEHLIEIGLLREQLDPIDEAALTEDQKKTFFIILKDREEKLAPLFPVADKAQRLLESLNRKLAPKVVRLDVDSGYQVLSASGAPLKLRDLSSGEQHELVLFHELLFDVQPGSLILIDEPELSLHVTWQVDLLADLIAIARLADLDIMLATHSPYIVGDHTDLMVRLGEPV
ncbi:MAG: ATP-binding protein [Nannocystis sp.]|nr:ATP-binding protein [Nannocystis sp.]